MVELTVVSGDITGLAVDAIVNAANSSLLGGGGVDGAIHRAAGPKLTDYCRSLGGCPTGEARISPGFDLPARWVIHCVGPVYRDGLGGEPEQLASCYREALKLAQANACHSIAFPAISCGVYGYPADSACQIAVTTVVDILRESIAPSKVVFCCFGAKMHALYQCQIALLKQEQQG